MNATYYKKIKDIMLTVKIITSTPHCEYLEGPQSVYVRSARISKLQTN